MTFKSIALVGIIIIFLGCMSLIASPAKQNSTPNKNTGVDTTLQIHTEPKQGWIRFTNNTHTWTIDTSSSTQVIVDTIQMKQVGYLPTCDGDTAILCVYLSPSMFSNTNFQGAAVSVNVLSATSSTACLSQQSSERLPKGITTINNVPFQTFTTGDAAMSHQSSGENYRAWHTNTCYELRTRINTTNYEVYAPNTITKFTDTDRTLVQTMLNATVQSFYFLK